MNDSAANGTPGTPPQVGDPACVLPIAGADRLALMLAALGNRLLQEAAPRLAAIDLDDRDYSVLAILVVDGPNTQHEIARLLGKAPGVVVAAVDQLESKGLVERQRDPADRRRSRVLPTPAGIRALARADKIGDDLISDVLSGLNPAEIKQLQALLNKGTGLA